MIFGLTCLVFKTTRVDRRKPLREDAFFFMRRTLFPSLDKRNMCDKAKGLCITSERHIGELSVRCLSTLNRGQDSIQQSHPASKASERCAEGVKFSCARKFGALRTEILRRGERAEKTGEKPRISRRTKVTSDALTPLSPHSSPLLGMREPPTDGFGEHLRILCRS